MCPLIKRIYSWFVIFCVYFKPKGAGNKYSTHSNLFFFPLRSLKNKSVTMLLCTDFYKFLKEKNNLVIAGRLLITCSLIPFFVALVILVRLFLPLRLWNHLLLIRDISYH